MKLKSLALVALAAAAATPVAAQINSPVPTANYITFRGNDWAWASPCGPTGVNCGNGTPVSFAYQGGQGWRLATTADLLAGPSASDFGTASNFKCAAAYFSTYTYCDYSDAASGYVFGLPTVQGANPAAETWVIRAGAGAAVPEPATWAMMVGGMALAGGFMRRRRPVAVAAA